MPIDPYPLLGAIASPADLRALPIEGAVLESMARYIFTRVH